MLDFYYLYQLFRVLPVILIFESILLAIGLNSSLYWWFVLIGIIINGVIWFILVKIFSKYEPEWEIRPNKMHCSYFETNKPIKEGGLPSGHCQTMGFFVMWILISLIVFEIPLIITIPLVILLTWMVWFMMYSRAMYFKCHTWPQAITGILVGMSSAIPLWYLYYYLLNKNNT